MRGLLVAAAIALALLIAVSSSQAQVPDCVDGSPPQPAGGTVAINPPAPVVNHDTIITGNFSDSRPYVDGSMRTTVTRPDGTKVTTFRSENERFTPTQAGDYVATVTATYVGCVRDVEPQYVTDTAGPTPFKVGAGRDPKLFVKAIVRRSHGSGHGSAFLQANVECGDSTTATGLPLKFAIYYDLKGRKPSHGSVHVSGTAVNGCQGRSSKDTHGRKAKRLYTIEADDGNAQLNVSEPQRMRVLIEMTQGSRVLAVVRASFKKGGPGESVKRESGQRFKTTFI